MSVRRTNWWKVLEMEFKSKVAEEAVWLANDLFFVD
jgi:hypothetical protein